jgi:hypothetical protein
MKFVDVFMVYLSVTFHMVHFCLLQNGDLHMSYSLTFRSKSCVCSEDHRGVN